MKNKSVDNGLALIKARQDAMSKHGYGKVYDLLGTALNVSNGDSTAALVWLAEKFYECDEERYELWRKLQPKPQMRKFQKVANNG